MYGGNLLKVTGVVSVAIEVWGNILNIGKTKGIIAVFENYADDVDYWKGKKVKDVPGCARRMIYRGTYIDDKIKMLQAGKLGSNSWSIWWQILE